MSATLLFVDLGSRVLSTNDEARFPMLARDILSEGHWLLPRLDGIPHLNKPPLHAWLIALASWPTGAVTPWTASLPSVFAALGVILATYGIARRLFDPESALVAGLTVLTTVGVFSLARVPMPDMTFCAAITGAMAAYVAAELNGRRGALLAFYGLSGIAFWTKGPAGLLPLAVVAVDLSVTHGRTGLRRVVSAPGLIVLILLVGAWGGLIVAAPNAERFAHDVMLLDLLSWYVPTKGPGWRQLLQPPLQALTILLPWSVLLPGAIWVAIRSGDSDRARQMRLLLLWLGVLFVLVAVTREQRMRYYLPLCPPAALLIAGWYSTFGSRRRTLVFAGVWVLVVTTGLTIDAAARARHNAATDLREASGQLSHATRVYAVDAPELVFAFYLERPVTILFAYHDYEARIHDGHDGDLIINERATPTPLHEPVRRVAAAVVSGRRFAILTTAPAEAAPLTTTQRPGTDGIGCEGSEAESGRFPMHPSPTCLAGGKE